MSKDKESESLELSENDNLELLITQKKLDKANERILELEDEFNTAELCWIDALDFEEKHRKKLDAANKLLLFNVKELDFQSQEAVRFKSELGAANEIIEKLKSGINSELERCGGTVPILKQTLKEVKEMEDVN